MKIQVTQDHIDQGEAKVCNKCPVALALQALPFVIEAAAFPYELYILIIDSSKDDCIFAPPEVTEFIRDFDNGLKPKPFEFELDFGKITIPDCGLGRTFSGKES